MSLTLQECSDYLQNGQIRAFLRCIREGESGQDDSAYTIVNGGTHFDAPPWVHPWHGVSTTHGARASGAYQFLGTTWARVADALGLSGDQFTPPNQDCGAVYLIAGRGALQAILDGDLVKACSLLRDEWVSLPNLGLQRLQATFLKYGGRLTPGAEVDQQRPILERPHLEQPQIGGGASADNPEKSMVPIIGALLPTIVQAIPALIQVFGKGARAEQNAKAAQIVADTVVKATDSVNLQEAAEKIVNDPAMQQAAQAAVLSNPSIATLMEVGGGIQEARKADQAAATNPLGWWRPLLTPAFVISLILLGLVWFVAWNMLLGKVDLWRPEDRSQVLMLTIAITSGVMGYFLGSSLGSQKKDDALVARQP